jgi:hypothetical protein
MSVCRSIWIIRAGVLLPFFCGSMFAASSMKLFTHASRGRIVSINANELVLEHRNKGEVEVLHFVLTADTVHKGSLAVGAVVSVHYRIEKNQHIATSIQAQPSNPAKPTSH